jgi:hypothetical protein
MQTTTKRTSSADRCGVISAFLKDALAGGAVVVAELEAEARAAMLLGQGQGITHSKRFKRAKKELGVRSIRDGFGRGGEWFWELPSRPSRTALAPMGHPSAKTSVEATYAEDDADSKSASKIAPTDARDLKPLPHGFRERGGIPLEWINGVARLDRRRAPVDVPQHRWQVFVRDCEIFCQSWAGQAADLGWDDKAIFGCSKSQPLSYLRVAGLVWALAGRKLIRLYPDSAFIENPADGSQHVFNRRAIYGAQIVLPWRLQ